MSQNIGKYEIVAEIGRGGFGSVYRALDPSISRYVALKVLREVDHDLLTRFRTEAQAASKLQHPNIVTIYDYGEDQGQPYIAMELVEDGFRCSRRSIS